MRSSLMTVALLCFVAWMSLPRASTLGHVSTCCRQWSNTKGIPHSRIRHYTLQVEGVCPIQAVVFHTRSGKRICSDPHDSWTQKTISKLDQRQASKMQGSKADEPTSTITPTASAVTERLSSKPEQTTLTSPGSDPDTTRTSTAAMKTDKEPEMLQMKGNNEDGSATAITPTASSTSTSKPKKKGRRPGRRMRKKSRSGRKWMKKVHVVCEHSLSMDQ